MEEELTGPDAFYLKSWLPGDVSSVCPACRSDVTISDLICEEDVCCPDCGRVATISVIDDTLIIFWTVNIEQGRIRIQSSPELPHEKRARLQDEYDITQEEAEKLTTVKEWSDLFEELVSHGISSRTSATFVADSLVQEIEYRSMSLSSVELDGVEKVLLDYEDEEITWKGVVKVLRQSLDEDIPVGQIYEDIDIGKTSGDELEDICIEVIQEETDAVEDYQDGDEEAIHYLVGQVMQKTDGEAEADEATEILESEI